jgi:hypothetical protein
MSEGNSALVAKQPMLINVGKRPLSVRGFRHDVFIEHLQDHLGKRMSRQWCEVSCLARVFFGRNTEANREAVRERLRGAFRVLLGRGLFLLIERAEQGHGHHGEALAVKLYVNGEGLEKNVAESQLARMAQRHEISGKLLNIAEGIIASTPLESTKNAEVAKLQGFK